MPSKKSISTAERRHQDYLRRKTLRVASVYETRLEKARRKELRRVLDMARDYSDPIALVPLLEGQLDETGYLGKWWQGLVLDTGLPIAKTTARDLRAMKAAGEEDVWLSSLRNYATARAGQEISVVTGTWRKTLVGIVRELLAEDLGLGVEKLTKEIYQRYLATIEKWQCRRIAQTEAMIGMAEAANNAAQTLSIHFTKQWCISGLGNTRASHELMDGLIVDEDEPFSLPGGMMMYPHDTSMGADAGEIINCACCCIRRPKNTHSSGTEPQSPNATALQPSNTEPGQRQRRIEEIMAEMDQTIPEDTRRAIAVNCIELEKALGMKKGKPMSIDDADMQKANPKWKLGTPYQKNCATTVPAFLLRERGFDITAKGITRGSLNSIAAKGKNVFNMWKDSDGNIAKPSLFSSWMKEKGYKQMNEKRYIEFFNEKCSERGTYVFSFRFKEVTNGHAAVLKRLPNGKLVYIETQEYNRILGTTQEIEEAIQDFGFSLLKSSGVMRVDDKLFDVNWAGLFSTE